MKHSKSKFLALFFAVLLPIGLIFTSCGGDSKPEDTNNVSTEVNTEEETTSPTAPGEEGRALFMNTTMVSTGVIVNAMSAMFAGLGKANAQEPPKVAPMIDSIGIVLNTAFDSLETNDPDLYGKFFQHPGVKEGLALASSNVPEGFKSFTEPMTAEEQMKYIDHIGTLGGDDKSDPVITYYNGIMEWFMEWSQEIDKDPELSSVMKDES